MKRITTTALAALALAATLPPQILADDPVTPVQGAVCNLYYLDITNQGKTFNEISSALPSKPACATFVDSVSDFKCSNKKAGIASSWGMWTGWMKQEKAGVYTFTCKRHSNYHGHHMYSIWINGQPCAKGWQGQGSFDVELSAGFNEVKIVTESPSNEDAPLSITYKKKGSVKDPMSFGPENMFYDDEE